MRKTTLVLAALLAGLLVSACDDLLPSGDFEPTGTAFNLDPDIDFMTATGDPRYFVETGPVTLSITLRSNSGGGESDVLPAGLFFRPLGSRIQNVILLKDHPVAADSAATATLLGSFCCNYGQFTPDGGDTFRFGPVTDNTDLNRIIDIVRDKDISDQGDMFMVQNAVYLVTDSTGLTQAYIDSLNGLPPETADGTR